MIVAYTAALWVLAQVVVVSGAAPAFAEEAPVRVAAPSPMASASPSASPIPALPPSNSSTSPKSTARAAAKKVAAPAFLPQILQEVEAKYALAKTMQAEFKQVNEVASLKRKDTSTGKIAVKRPDKLRWETLAPNPTQLISDGKHFWFYTPPYDPKDPSDHGQVVERKSSQIQSRLANALLSGSFSVARDMKIAAEGAFKFVLTPKPGSAGTVKKAWIEINPTERLIQQVTIEHRGGNRSEITLSKIELGVDLSDDQFEFKAPANTDKIDP